MNSIGRFLTLCLALLTAMASGVLAGEEPSSESTDGPAGLKIVKAYILDGEGGYSIPPDSVFFPGETVYLRFEVGGYTRGEFDRVRLSWRIDSFGPGGDRFVMADAGKIDAELAPQDKDWRPIIRHAPLLPAHAEAGGYQITLQVVDELNMAKVTKHMAIHVRGQQVPAGNELTVRNFTFSKVEGGAPLPELVLDPGDTLWAKFYITGFQVASDHSYDVHAELELRDEAGELLFTFDPQGEQGSPYYPRRWLPGTFRMDLDDDIRPGSYSIVLSLQDRLGNQSVREHKLFLVQ